MSTNPSSPLATSNTAQASRWIPPEARLRRYKQSELASLFASLPDVDTAQLAGAYRGRIYGVKGLQSLPRFMQSLVLAILNLRLPIWIGKSFDGAEGANLWLSFNAPRRFGYYHIRPPANGQALQLDYSTAENPALLHPILGEVRQAGDNVFLARMLLRAQKTTHCILYFTLESHS